MTVDLSMRHLNPELEHDGRYSWWSEANCQSVKGPKYPQMPSIWPSLISQLKLLFYKWLQRGPESLFPWEKYAICSDQIKFPHAIPVPEEYQTELFCADMSCSLHTNVILKQQELLVSMHHKDDKNLSILTIYIYIYYVYICRIKQSSFNIQPVLRLGPSSPKTRPALPVARRWWTRWAAPGNTEVWNRTNT